MLFESTGAHILPFTSDYAIPCRLDTNDKWYPSEFSIYEANRLIGWMSIWIRKYPIELSEIGWYPWICFWGYTIFFNTGTVCSICHTLKKAPQIDVHVNQGRQSTTCLDKLYEKWQTAGELSLCSVTAAHSYSGRTREKIAIKLHEKIKSLCSIYFTVCV